MRLLVRAEGSAAQPGRRGLRLWSRTGKPLDHLASLLEPDLAASLPPGITLDGELYAHGAGFQTVVSLVKNRRASDAQRSALEYHVYDLIDAQRPRLSFRARAEALARLLAAVPGGAARVRAVPTVSAGGPEEVEALMRRFVDREGFEGVIVREPGGVYECGRRSAGLLKLKRFLDGEFRIVGWAEAGGKDAGTVVLRCVTPAGREFRVRPMGTREERARMLRDAPRLVGRLLTVRFQELSDDGVPRFPVGVAVRDYE